MRKFARPYDVSIYIKEEKTGTNMITKYARPGPLRYIIICKRFTREKEKNQTIYNDCVKDQLPQFGGKNNDYLLRNVTLSFSQDSLSENVEWHNY